MNQTTTRRVARPLTLRLVTLLTGTLITASALAMLPPRYHFAKKVGRISSAEAARKAANTVVELKVLQVKSTALPADARRRMVVANIPHTVTGRVMKSLRGGLRVGRTVTFTMTEVRQLAPGPARFSDGAPAVGSLVTAHLSCAGHTCHKAVPYLGFLNDRQFAAAKGSANASAVRHGAALPPRKPAPAPPLGCDLLRAAQTGMVCLRFERPRPVPKSWQPGCLSLSARAAPPNAAMPAEPRVVCRTAAARRPLLLPGTSGAIDRVVDHRSKAAVSVLSTEPMCSLARAPRRRGCVWVACTTSQHRLLGGVRSAYERAGWAFQCAGRSGVLLCRPQPVDTAPLTLPALPRG